jgi:HK97 gp10 family phage protein
MKAYVKNDKSMEKKMKTAVDMIWRVAHQKRPMITRAQMKIEGRSKRVSDPGAQLGVPVDTGRLQASIHQNVTRGGKMKYRGEIVTKGVPYAGFMEYGTSKIQKRPFMRPAILLTKDAIKKTFGLRVEANL